MILYVLVCVIASSLPPSLPPSLFNHIFIRFVGAGAIGALDWTAEERKKLAVEVSDELWKNS